METDPIWLYRARCVGRSPRIIHSYVEYMPRLLHTPLQRCRAFGDTLIFMLDSLREVYETVACASRGLARSLRIRLILDKATTLQNGPFQVPRVFT